MIMQIVPPAIVIGFDVEYTAPNGARRELQLRGPSAARSRDRLLHAMAAKGWPARACEVVEVTP